MTRPAAAPLRAALYARYSSDLQSAASIEDQLRLARALALQAGYEVVAEHTDAAVSGATLLRPGLQALIADAARGAFDVVVTEALDRLSRSQADIAHLYERLRFAGVTIMTRSESTITELHIGLKGTMNALFLKDLAEKTHRGLEGRVRAGKSAGGCSYGYRTVVRFAPDGARLRGDVAIVEEEAAIVRRILSLYASGRSPQSIAAELNADGVPAPRSEHWGPSTIQGNRKRGTGILNNALYVGRRVWNRQRYAKDPATGQRLPRLGDPANRVEEPVPDLRLVDDALWSAVKARQALLEIKGTMRRPEEQRRPVHLFSGLMVCGVCGGGVSMVAHDRVGCSRARNMGATVCANRRTTSRSRVEARVLRALTEHLMEPDLVRVFCEAYAAERNRLSAGAGAERAAREAELARVRRDHAKLVDAIVAGVAPSQLKERMDTLDARRQALEAELAAVPAADPVRLHPAMAGAYRERVRALVEELTAQVAGARRPQAREAIRALVERIVLTPIDVAGRRRSEVRIDLHGALSGILHLAAGAKAAAAGLAFVEQGMAPTASEQDVTGHDESAKRTAPRAASSGTPNEREPAPIGAGSVAGREVQGTLVAGAGFEPAAFRL